MEEILVVLSEEWIDHPAAKPEDKIILFASLHSSGVISLLRGLEMMFEQREQGKSNLKPETTGEQTSLSGLVFSADELRALQRRVDAEPFDYSDPYPLASIQSKITLDTYTNGAFVGDDRQLQELDATSTVVGTPIHLNPNGHRSWLIDAHNSLMGIISPRLGRLFEREATEDVIQDIVEKLGTGLKIRRICHSQGAIVESNALFLLKDRMTKDEWTRLTDRVEVLALGPAIYEWPADVNVKAYAFDTDPCPSIVRVPDLLFKPLQYFRDGQHVKPLVIPLPGYSGFQAHSLPRYMNNFHRFLLADEAPSGAAPFASNLITMMHEERYTGQVFDRLLEAVFKRSEPAVEQFDIGQFSEVLLDSHIDGKIGAYTPLPSIISDLEVFSASSWRD